jgi:hypothetical protein
MDEIFQVTRELGKLNVRNIYFWHYSVRSHAVPSLLSVYDPEEVHKSMCHAAATRRQEVLQTDAETGLVA